MNHIACLAAMLILGFSSPAWPQESELPRAEEREEDSGLTTIRDFLFKFSDIDAQLDTFFAHYRAGRITSARAAVTLRDAYEMNHKFAQDMNGEFGLRVESRLGPIYGNALRRLIFAQDLRLRAAVDASTIEARYGLKMAAPLWRKQKSLADAYARQKAKTFKTFDMAY